MSTASLAPPAGDSFSIRSILAPLAAIVLGTFMAILDNTIVNVAFPTIERVFHADLHLMQWIITGYMLAQAAIIPLAGWLSDRFGAKPLYVTALALFTLGSLLCAMAPTAQTLIAFRVLQGLGGGMLMPIGMAFLYRLAPPDKRGIVMGAFGIPILLAPALGPVLSGWLVQYFDWRLIFLINLPVGVISVIVAMRALPDIAAQRAAGSLDLAGAILGPLSFAALTYGISESTSAGWTGTNTLGGIAIGVVALALFVARELTTEHPLLELRIFKSIDFSLALLTQWVIMASLMGTIFLVPLFLQTVRGYGAFETGLFTFSNAIMAAIAMPIGGKLFDRYGVRPPALVGFALAGIGLFLMSRLNAGTGGSYFIIPLAVWGFGVGLSMMQLNTHTLNAAPRDLVSRVTSVTAALQNVVASLAIATLSTILQSRTAVHLSGRPTPGALRNALAMAFKDDLHVLVGVAMVGWLLVWTLRRRQAESTEIGLEEREPMFAAG